MAKDAHNPIGSRQEHSVLSFFLLAPARSFGTRELSKRLRMTQGKLVSALSKLVESGVLRSFGKKGIKYYILKAKGDELLELRRSVLKGRSIKKVKDNLVSSIRKLGRVRAAFLSGLFTGNPELPVDLLLVGRINLNKLSKFLSSCRKMVGQEINYSIMREDEFTQRRDTFDRFIKDIFDYKHLAVVDNIKKKKH